MKEENEPALSLQGVKKRYNKGLPLIESASFAVKHGEVVVIVGPSGSGKSTILQIAAGFMAPDSGIITINGDHAFLGSGTKNERRGSLVSYVPQDDMLFESLSVYENLMLALELTKSERDAFDKQVRDSLVMVEVDDLHDRMIQDISAGERRRVAIARGLVVGSKIVIIDEPTSSLDSDGTTRLMKAIREKADVEKIAFLIASHDLTEIRPFATRIYEIRNFELHEV